MTTAKEFKSLSKNELARRLVTASECVKSIGVELDKCLNGYITVCAHLMHENPTNEYLGLLTPSSRQKVGERYIEIYGGDTNALLSRMREIKKEGRAATENADTSTTGCDTKEL